MWVFLDHRYIQTGSDELVAFDDNRNQFNSFFVAFSSVPSENVNTENQQS